METVKTAGSFPRDIEDNIQQLADDLFEIMIPYPYTHALVNTYLVRGNDRDLLIDCGGPDKEAHKLLVSCLNELGVDQSKLDVFLTHLHADHIGGLEALWHPGMRVFAGVSTLMKQHWANDNRFNLLFPMLEEFESSRGNSVNEEQDFPAAYYRVTIDPPITRLHEGNVLHWGKYSFKVLHTPGHERSELSLWDKEKGILFSGDALIKGTNSNMYPQDLEQDDVATYLAMINRIKQLSVRVAYVGHGSAMDHQEFVDACDHAIDHHNRRIRDVLQVVKKEYRHLPEITYYFAYQGERRRWEKYPIAFHWNLMVEITAYLSHLVCIGAVEICRENGNLLYRLSDCN